MAAPKHLWSGDWEQESANAADQRPALPAPEPEATPVEEPEAPRRWRRMLGVRQVSAAVATLAVVAVAIALVAGSGGSPKSSHKSGAATRTSRTQGGTGGVALPPSSPSFVAGPSVTWLGMQIVDSPLGAVVATVPAGSTGDTVGFEPGDVITQVGNDLVNSPQQIRRAVANLALGQQIQITISRGSSILSTAVTLRERPTLPP